MKSLFASLRFLSILPVPQSWAGDTNSLSKSVKFFPVTGLIMAAIAAGCVYLFSFLLPQVVVAAITVVLIAALTRGLHLDGLADTADGFWSVSDRKRTLEIMKDSFIGAMGVIAIASVLLLKFACLNALDDGLLWRGVLLMVLFGRCMMVLPISLFPYARKEDGLGKLFYETRSVFNAIWAIAIIIVAGWFVAGIAGLAAGFAAILATVAFGFYCKWKIGGVTGDTIGATCEITEVVTILVMCGWSAF
ncbi:MAG: adenosylcobinamide-GDP ribazoletransferase [Planctomycetes bacterium]|nr:adenosylcobinamide-GDP ribazoletransferase [Planctomycetota bacterium]